MPQHTLSTQNDAITAALTEFVTDIQNHLNAALATTPRDREDIAFWTRQLNAHTKAQSYWSDGIRPTHAGGAYLVPSASQAGAVIHRCIQIGGVWVCSCKAGQNQILCWHHALIVVLDRAAELAAYQARLDDEANTALAQLQADAEDWETQHVGFAWHATGDAPAATPAQFGARLAAARRDYLV